MGIALARLVRQASGRHSVTKLWGGRFEGGPSDALWALSVSTDSDRHLLADDCAVLALHASRLQAAGLLEGNDLDEAVAALQRLALRDAGDVITEEDEDIHSAVERVLLSELPDIAPRLRAGLSRNDRVASAFRRTALRSASAKRQAILRLVSVLVDRAREHATDPMPGYTHLQRAQPVTIGHHLLAHAWSLLRDAERLDDAIARASGDPLGAGALAGSTLDLPQVDEPIANSLDAVAARDHILELLSAYAICGIHLSRLCEEVILWTSSEFAFAEMDDAWSTGSSLMPQKKNPDVAELVRGKSGRLVGNLTTLLMVVKGLPLAYNRDLQEDKEPFFDSDQTLQLSLDGLAGLMKTLSFDRAKCREAASDPMLFATDLAEALVAAGVPFRDAHDLVGAAVKVAGAAPDPAAALISEISNHLDEATVAACLDVDTSIRKRLGSGPGAIADQLASIRQVLATQLTERS